MTKSDSANRTISCYGDKTISALEARAGGGGGVALLYIGGGIILGKAGLQICRGMGVESDIGGGFLNFGGGEVRCSDERNRGENLFFGSNMYEKAALRGCAVKIIKLFSKNELDVKQWL